ncbi:glycoside hydrolase family 3 C-terminal domain-containing protein [Mycolicibacterium sp.]|uniref:beta-glucosidase family protein n=1 Tax=Mycolicibacterium sp. TaxID=2320850 RepID=UPI0028AB4BD2|nr:glycoside hydrolase family 3 C-terminal domain-containing protein [Mycolicibacterium sp.]
MSATDPICPPGTAFAAAVEAVRAGARNVQGAASELISRLSEPELLNLLDGDLTILRGLIGMSQRYNKVPFEAGRIDRLGIPGIRFTDGPRGVALGASTAFPVAIARAATWDPELERRIAGAIGTEARAQGANLWAGICINLPYAPGWGRSQESYGEDPLLLGTMGAAAAEGANPWVMSCVKHFALNSMEEARFRVDVRVPEDVLREVYLPHFRAVVEAGADCVMSAYNSVNGTWAGQNAHLLTEILRDDWGFTGFVMTDFIWGLRDPVGSVLAGQDLEMPFRQQRAATLPAALADGRLKRADVEQAAHRQLAAQIRLALRANPHPSATVVASEQHRRLAREAARRGAVLLRNDSVRGAPALPLDESSLSTVALLGTLADQPNQGDVGSSLVSPPSSVTILDGLRERLGDRLIHVSGTDPEPAVGAARGADAAVIVVGLSSEDEGESMIGVDTATTRLFGGIARWRPVAAAMVKLASLASALKKFGGDRRDLRLSAEDVALIRAVAAVNERTVVVVIGGGTIVLDPWDGAVAAVLLAWYPGMEGGRAIADVLFGDAEPAGRLPLAIPRRQGDLPEVDWDADTVTYSRWWGQRKLDRDGVPAAYPLGFGLGYTTFGLSDLTVGAVEEERFSAAVTVTNTGDRSGRHVVQIYAVRPADTGRPVHYLVGFGSVHVAAGQSRRIVVDCSTRPLQRWTADGFALDIGDVTVRAGSHAGDPAAVEGTLAV